MARIGLVHALHASLAPIAAAFEELWPEAETVNLFDESLYVEYDRAGRVTDELAERIDILLRYSERCGVDAILFTGSLFGAPVEATRRSMGIPVLTAYEAMIEQAFQLGRRFGLLATVADTITLIQADIERFASSQGLDYELDTAHVNGALEALLAGDRKRHDRLIIEAADGFDASEVLLLGQFSMAPVRQRIADGTAKPVLTSPGCAVAKLKTLVG